MGGTAARRDVVVAAVTRYVEAGLSMPDLEVHLHLDADDREHFQQITGATAWLSADVVWRQRGAEIAANTLAHGLLSTRLASADERWLEFERFEALTGISSPRLAEIEPVADVTRVVSTGDPTRLAAYEAWRANRSRSAPVP